MTARTSRRSEATVNSKKKKEELIEENQREWINFAEQSFIGSQFDPNAMQKGISFVRMDKNEINRLLKSPYTNYKALQNYSRLFMNMEGIYYRLIKQFSTMLTYDHMLIPYAESKALEKYKDKLKDYYDTASIHLEKMNLKSILPVFAEDFFIDGECYYYKIEDATGIVYQKIDNDYCLPYKNENGLWRFVIDCQRLASAIDISVYPIEIQKAFNIYNNKGSEGNPMFILDKYYPVKNGICFSTVKDGKHGTPPFAFLLKDLIALEQKKELKDKIDRINNTKMIHNKIETKDKDIMIDPKVAKTYNEAIKKNLIQKNLDEGIFTITNPFDASVLNLDTKNAQTENLVKSSIYTVFSEVGVNQNLFNNDSTSTEAIKANLITNGSYVVNMILKMFEGFINEDLRISAKTKVRMKCLMLDNTVNNQAERRSTSSSELAYGGSRLRYLADCSYTPMQAMNLLYSEQALGIDKLFVPIATSHTMSQKNNNGGGRPNSEEMRQQGGEVSEITDQVNDNK